MKYLPGDSINEIQEDTFKRIYGYLHLHDSRCSGTHSFNYMTSDWGGC